MYLNGNEGGASRCSGKHDVLLTTVINQVAELDPAELLMLADYLKGMKLARNFRK